MHGEHDREARPWDRGQSPHGGGARPPRACPGRAGDEPADVGLAATRANVETLVERGMELIGPDEGEMAEGEWGVGRLAEPEEIVARALQLLAPGPLAGRRVLVSAGGTREPIDSVRFVGNRSSGRMGVALAEEARRRGAEVILLAANLAVPAPTGVEVIPTPTSGVDVRRRAGAPGH